MALEPHYCWYSTSKLPKEAGSPFKKGIKPHITAVTEDTPVIPASGPSPYLSEGMWVQAEGNKGS